MIKLRTVADLISALTNPKLDRLSKQLILACVTNLPKYVPLYNLVYKSNQVLKLADSLFKSKGGRDPVIDELADLVNVVTVQDQIKVIRTEANTKIKQLKKEHARRLSRNKKGPRQKTLLKKLQKLQLVP